MSHWLTKDQKAPTTLGFPVGFGGQSFAMETGVDIVDHTLILWKIGENGVFVHNDEMDG